MLNFSEETAYLVHSCNSCDLYVDTWYRFAVLSSL